MRGAQQPRLGIGKPTLATVQRLPGILKTRDATPARLLEMHMSRVAVILSASLTLTIGLKAFAAPPATAKKPVTDDVQSVKIIDNYRWLEDWNDPEVQKWSETQNGYARSVLDKIPCVPALRARITELENSLGVEYHGLKPAGGKIFAIKNQPPKQQPLIVVLRSLNDTTNEKVVLDPNTLDKEGHTAFDWFVPSPDGRYVAVSVSSGGSESGDVRVYVTDTGEELAKDRVLRVNGGTAGGALVWTPDSKGFYYTRYPRDGERPAADMDFYTQLWFHALRAPATPDAYQVGRDYPKIAEIQASVSADGNWALSNVQNGDGGEFIQDIKGPDRKWTRLSRWEDRIVEAKFGPDADGSTALYVVSRKDAPRGKVLRIPLASGKAPSLADAQEVIPQLKDASIETAFEGRTGIVLTRNRIYTQYQVGGPNELRVFDLTGKFLGVVPTLPISTVGDVEPLDPQNSDDLAFSNVSYITEAAYYKLTTSNDGLGTLSKTALTVQPPPHMPELEVKRDFAISKDGTKVPVNIIMPAGCKPDGKTPTIVWGYGGYGVNEAPVFSRRRLAWLDQGCIFVVANIRGGGEYGEEWHLQGNLTKKQNVFDDFAAACSYVVEHGYTNKDKLAIMGGSNGGLLMGATFTQHPEMFKAVVSSVGIYDMLRVELSPNGAFNVTEFGTVKNPDQFKALYAYSPYHHVQDGAKYPAILFMTGANDPRVDPMQSRKMTARLQDAQRDAGGGTVILRTSGNTGHGMGTPLSARIEQTVDTYAFLIEQLGVNYKTVGSR